MLGKTYGRGNDCSIEGCDETRRYPKGSRLCTEHLWARTRIQAAKYRAKLKETVLEAYGSACSCCGEDNPGFLTIDHINNDGAERKRKGEPKGGPNWHNWIIKNNFPDDLQLLCYNCNCGRQWNKGICPHST